MSEIIINLGGEGEHPGAINVNLDCVLHPDWCASRDGTTMLPDVKQSGPVVVARSDCLPFAPGCADKILTNSVPVGNWSTSMGPAYHPDEIKRIKK